MSTITPRRRAYIGMYSRLQGFAPVGICVDLPSAYKQQTARVIDFWIIETGIHTQTKRGLPRAGTSYPRQSKWHGQPSSRLCTAMAKPAR